MIPQIVQNYLYNLTRAFVKSPYLSWVKEGWRLID